VAMAATHGIAHHEAGAASGLLNVSRQIGGAIGLASLVTIASSASQRLGHNHTALVATLHGYHVALLAAAGISLLAAFAALNLRRPA
jgi:sugar phosphate permease